MSIEILVVWLAHRLRIIDIAKQNAPKGIANIDIIATRMLEACPEHGCHRRDYELIYLLDRACGLNVVDYI